MGLRTGRLGRSDRLLHPRDFQRVRRLGERTASRYFVVLIAPRGKEDLRHAVCQHGGTQRLGITASRKVGNAVARNRVKRAVREWFRQERGRLGPGLDVVVIARREATGLCSRQVAEALRKLTSASRSAGQE